MDLTSNPIVVTAADVVAGALTIWTGKILVTNVTFEGYIAPTDNATINQINGKTFAYLSGTNDLQLVRTGDARHADGLVIPLGGITNGTLRIYHR